MGVALPSTPCPSVKSAEERLDLLDVADRELLPPTGPAGQSCKPQPSASYMPFRATWFRAPSDAGFG